jgi:hypothetical protein
MKIRPRKKGLRVLIILLLMLSMIIGYAAITTKLTINGTVATGTVNYDVRIENIQILENTASVIEDAHITDAEHNVIDFDIELLNVGDVYRFQFDVVNHGNLGAKLSDININHTNEYDMFNIRMFYADSYLEVKEEDFFEGNSTTPIIFEIRYRVADDVTDTRSIDTDSYFSSSISLNFVNSTKKSYEETHDTSKTYSRLLNREAKLISSEEYGYNSMGFYVIDNTLDDPNPIFFFNNYKGSWGTINNTNFMLFGDSCWRIIRTTSTGGLKLSYTGTSCDSIFGNYINYYYTATGEPYAGSIRQRDIDAWYFKNLINYQAYLSDEPFCNTSNLSDLNWGDCSDEYSITNGKLVYPVAIPSIDDVLFAGTAITAGNVGLLNQDKEFYVSNGNGNTQQYYITPVIYLHGGFRISGEGTSSNPYYIDEE